MQTGTQRGLKLADKKHPGRWGDQPDVAPRNRESGKQEKAE